MIFLKDDRFDWSCCEVCNSHESKFYLIRINEEHCICCSNIDVIEQKDVFSWTALINMSPNSSFLVLQGIKLLKKWSLSLEIYGSYCNLRNGKRLVALHSHEHTSLSHLLLRDLQNWQHVLTLFDHLNRIPQSQHGTDFMRIREWWDSFECITLYFPCLNCWATTFWS